MPEPDLRISIELGPATSDAVVLDGRDDIVAKAKLPSEPDVGARIRGAVRAAGEQAKVPAARITRAMLGTTAEIDGALAGRAFRRVAVVRIGGPLTFAAPPLVGWPAPLRQALSGGEAIVKGGAEVDGRVHALDEEEIVRFFAKVAGRVDAVAVTGVFSLVAPEQELAVAELARRELGRDMPTSLSHELGALGLLERENATVLNAGLVNTARRLAATFEEVLAAEGIDAETFFARNDGTVMALDYAARFPALLAGSGPAGGIRAAAFLSGVEDGLVIDAGSAVATIGVLANGYPRESVTDGALAGVPVALRVPDVSTVPLDGDTPAVHARLAEACTRAQGTLAAPTVIVAIGGAAGLVHDALAGICEVIQPVHAEVAQAIGSAIAPVSGRAELICSNRPSDRSRALELARAAAIERAIGAGARPAGVEIVDVEEIPLTGMDDPAIRIRATAVGPPGRRALT
jgi:N-methylhydantoinase A/oxoprolinase/acetone carboxylase beta subunit